MTEFDLIALIARRARPCATRRGDVHVGIGDDAAIVQVPAGRQLVVATDTLNAGVHFFHDTAPADIGWKALAVNLSDLAAMGAEPAWCTLSLSLPASDAPWLDGFLDGFLELAAQHRLALIGGDTTRGPLSVCVTVLGLVETGRALRRAAARVDHDIWVSGTLGDAAAALRLWGTDPERHWHGLRERLDRPTPRVALGLALIGVAHAAIDISDGLLADLGHVCQASHVAAELRLDDLPMSDALRTADPTCGLDMKARRGLQACGGDDYELCFTAPASACDEIERIARSTDTRLTRIGRIVAGEGVRVFNTHGERWQAPAPGYVHFADG